MSGILYSLLMTVKSDSRVSMSWYTVWLRWSPWLSSGSASGPRVYTVHAANGGSDNLKLVMAS